MATVYRAVDLKHGRAVAIKVWVDWPFWSERKPMISGGVTSLRIRTSSPKSGAGGKRPTPRCLPDP